MGTVPKSTKADIKFFFGLSLQRIGIAIMVGFVSFSICQETISNAWLQIIMSLIFVAISLVLSGRSPSNPRITFAKGLILFVLNFFEPKNYTELKQKNTAHTRKERLNEMPKSKNKISYSQCLDYLADIKEYCGNGIIKLSYRNKRQSLPALCRYQA